MNINYNFTVNLIKYKTLLILSLPAHCLLLSLMRSD